MKTEEISIASIDDVKASEIWVPVDINSNQLKSESCGLCLSEFEGIFVLCLV